MNKVFQLNGPIIAAASEWKQEEFQQVCTSAYLMLQKIPLFIELSQKKANHFEQKKIAGMFLLGRKGGTD